MQPENNMQDSLVKKHLRRNYILAALDFSIYSLALSIASSVTIIPLYVSHLTSSAILIGLIPAIIDEGWRLPQIFTVNYISRLPLKKYYTAVCMVIERIPFLLLGLSILLFPHLPNSTSLLILIICLVIFSVGGGLGGTSWQDLVAKIIPAKRRGVFFGVSNSLSGLFGIGGAALSAYFLFVYPFPKSFAVTFLATFIILFAAIVFILFIAEPKDIIPAEQNKIHPLALLPNYLRKSPNFVYFLAARSLAAFGLMGFSYVTVYAVQILHLGDDTAAYFTLVMMLSQLLLTPLLGLLADRKGHKLVLEVSSICIILAMVFVLCLPKLPVFFLAFILIGLSRSADLISGLALPMEFGSPQDRPFYIAISNTLTAPALALAPLIGGLLANQHGYTAAFIIALVGAVLSTLLLNKKVQDPRFS
jgi:MFS family permease